MSTPRFANVSCSQCGQDQGPGDHGFSHCRSHRTDAENAELDAFEAADGAAWSATRPVMLAIQSLTDNELNERAMALILDKLRARIEAGTWKHAEHATDAAERLTDTVYVLENAADARLRADL